MVSPKLCGLRMQSMLILWQLKTLLQLETMATCPETLFPYSFARLISVNQADSKTFVGYTFATLDKYIGYF